MSELSEERGSRLELATAAYFQAHGYLVRRGVVLSVAAGTAEATDVDLLGIRYSAPLAEDRLVADCKDRKKPKPYERVLWSLGLASFTRATRTVVVTQKPPWQARDFAAHAGVEVLGSDELEAALRELAKWHRPFGDADANLAARLDECTRNVTEQQKSCLRGILELRQMLVAGHPLTNVNRIIALLGSLGKERGSDPEVVWLRRFVAYDAAVIAATMFVRFAMEIKWTPEAQWKDYVRKRLTYGDMPPQKARELAKITFQAQFADGLPAPPYCEEVIQFLGNLISQPGPTTTLPNAVDYFLLGHAMMGMAQDGISEVVGPTAPDSVRTIKQLTSTLSYASGLDAKFWQPAQETAAPKRGKGAPPNHAGARDTGASVPPATKPSEDQPNLPLK